MKTEHRAQTTITVEEEEEGGLLVDAHRWKEEDGKTYSRLTITAISPTSPDHANDLVRRFTRRLSDAVS